MYLIDGNNLIGHTKSVGGQQSRSSRQMILDHIRPFLEATGRKAIVVFDGMAEPLRTTSRIKLIFAGPRSSADEVIRARVNATKGRKDFCVISSDNAVYGYARSCGFKALKCYEFNKLIRDSSDSYLRENRELQVDNINDWLRYFGEEK